MSVSVSAVPFMLISGLATLITATVQGLNGQGIERFHLDYETVEKLFNQEFETQIVDKQTLLKTLTEHGAVNIEDSSNDISCDCEEFHIEFKYNGDKPYTMRVSAKSDSGVDDLIKDLSSEYTANAQEVSYNKIKERLERQNLTIDDEEVYDDNTIVLTVNLD